jgi:hypothetical protein
MDANSLQEEGGGDWVLPMDSLIEYAIIPQNKMNNSLHFIISTDHL